MMFKTIPAFEQNRLYLGEHLTDAEFNRMAAYNDRHGGRLFDIGYKHIRFKNYVGAIQLGRKTIEILPKTDDLGQAEDAKCFQFWRTVLTQMLRRCGYLKLETLSNARLGIQQASLFDLYLESFLAEVASLTHHGLTRKYRPTQGNLRVLKGQIKFADNLRRNLVHRERLYTQHQTYDHNNLYNRILKQALTILKGGRWRAGITGEAARLLLDFEDIDLATHDAATFARLRFDRGTECYRQAVELARMIILNYSPDLLGGKNDLLAILFDMSALFQQYVLCELRREINRNPHSGMTIHGQISSEYWGIDGCKVRTIRPDILIKTAESRTVVLDTKWKLLQNNQPSDDDLKQMHVYNVQYQSRISYLVYPAWGRNGESHQFGWFRQPRKTGEPADHGCGIILAQIPAKKFEDVDDTKPKPFLNEAFAHNLLEIVRQSGEIAR